MSLGIVDWEQLSENFGQDKFAIGLLVDAYIQGVDKSLEAIASAIATNDRAALALSAHSLKGVTLNFGATEAVRIAQTLELVGTGQEKGDPEELLAQLRRHIHVLLLALQAEPEYYRDVG